MLRQETHQYGYVATAGGVQEKELNAQTKPCSAKHEK